MYEIALLAEGDVDRLFYQGDLHDAIMQVREEWDAGFGFGIRDMQTRVKDEEEARRVFEAVKAIMASSGLPHQVQLFVLSYDESEEFYDRDEVLDSVCIGL